MLSFLLVVGTVTTVPAYAGSEAGPAEGTSQSVEGPTVVSAEALEGAASVVGGGDQDGAAPSTPPGTSGAGDDGGTAGSATGPDPADPADPDAGPDEGPGPAGPAGPDGPDGPATDDPATGPDGPDPAVPAPADASDQSTEPAPPAQAEESDQPDQPAEPDQADTTDETGSKTSSKDEKAAKAKDTKAASAGGSGDLAPLAATTDLSGIYTIASILPGAKVFDIPAASRQDGAFAQIYTPNTTPAQRFRLERQRDGSYVIINVNSGKALDVRQGRAESSNLIWQYAPNGTAAQRWELVPTGDPDGSYSIHTMLDRKLALGLVRGASTNGTGLQLQRARAVSAQKFLLKEIRPVIANGYYIIHTKSSDKVLDIASAGTANGAKLQIYQDNDTFAQRFRVVYDAKTGYYTLTNVNALKPLDVVGSGTRDGTAVALHKANSTPAQRWTIVDNGKGVYRLYAACSGLVLEVKGGKTANRTGVHTSRVKKANAAQLWTFERAPLVPNKSIITLNSALGTVLDVKANGITKGTRVQTYTANNTQAQKFRAVAVGGGAYRIECLNSGLVLGLSGSNVVMTPYTKATTQHWKFRLVYSGGSYFFLQNGNGQVLDVAGASKKAGANVKVNPRRNSLSQSWKLVPTTAVGDGIYVVASALDTNMVLDIRAASLDNGAALQLYEANGTFAQKFSFVGNADGTCRIVPLNSSKPLEVKNELLDPASGQGTVQQWTWRAGSETSKRQTWKVEYVGDGEFRISSILGAGTSCLEVRDGNTVNSTEVLVSKKRSSSAQLFRFTNFTSTGAYKKAPLDGIDVSSWQPADIGSRVNYDFMIVKATGGTTYTNPLFMAQANSALERGKKLGLYHYAAEYKGQNSAVSEARHFVNGIRAYIGRAVLFLDYEEDVPGVDKVWIKKFCDEVYRLTSVKCNIYTSGSWAQSKINGLWTELGVMLWQANYWYDRLYYGYSHANTPMVSCNIYQYTSQGRLSGYNGNLDLNLFYGSTATWDYWAARR
jgi:GH25 family lysozyme M1 (1,4-beta-N-acetylmuramidase)